MKKINVNIIQFEYMGTEGKKVQVKATEVQVPFVRAFAVKEWKYWGVYEFSTGQKITGDLEANYTLKSAVEAATEKLVRYGEGMVKEALLTKEVINS